MNRWTTKTLKMQHSEKSIQQELRKLFVNHKYLLTNTYMFDWESDFFSCSDSNYLYEVEVKISRGDFKDDFLKGKHQYFKALHRGAKHMVKRVQPYRHDGSLLCRAYSYHLHIMESYRTPELDKTFTHDEDSFGYWQRNERYVNLTRDIENYHAPTSKVRIIELIKCNMPNRFYYAVPENLVKVSEIPSYAGLIYVTQSGAYIAKTAPFLTKENMFIRLTGYILQKFWQLTQDQMRELDYYKYKEQLKKL